MGISMYSLFMAVLWSSVLTVLLYGLRKHPEFTAQFGVYNILLLYLFSAGRMVLALEFPFTQELSIEFVLNPITRAFNTVMVSLNNSVITVGNLLIFGWLFIAFVLIVRFIKEYLENCRKLTYLKTNTEQKYRDALSKIQHHSSRYLKVDILSDQYINSPESIGIVKRRILLPAQEYTDSEIEFILKHEYQHFLNRDLLLKWLIHVYCCLFWWNPCVYLLKWDLEQILENKCDLTITENLTDEKRRDYLATILKVYKNEQLKRLTIGGMSFLGSTRKSSLEERFLLISRNKQIRKRAPFFQSLFSGFVVALFFVSYLFVAQSYFEVPTSEVESGQIFRMVDDGEMSILKNKDGSYTIISEHGKKDIPTELAETMIDDGIKIIEE